eukprot:1160425-Pelagomonas_calceolata.AAC.6
MASIDSLLPRCPHFCIAEHFPALVQVKQQPYITAIIVLHYTLLTYPYMLFPVRARASAAAFMAPPPPPRVRRLQGGHSQHV